MARRWEIDARRIGRCRRFRSSDLNEWLRRQERRGLSFASTLSWLADGWPVRNWRSGQVRTECVKRSFLGDVGG